MNVCTGIRSFGATDSEKAVIQFGTPLTLITGQNGAGKTVSLSTHSTSVRQSSLAAALKKQTSLFIALDINRLHDLYSLWNYTMTHLTDYHRVSPVCHNW